MQIHSLDHVNLRTSRVAEMIAWYRDMLSLPTGDRPDFSFGGAWIYVGDTAAVHLVEVETEQQNTAPKLEHFAFRASGLREFVDRLNRHGVAHTLDPVPGFSVVQVNLHDPDGNHIHIDFAADEADDLI